MEKTLAGRNNSFVSLFSLHSDYKKSSWLNFFYTLERRVKTLCMNLMTLCPCSQAVLGLTAGGQTEE